MLDIFTIYHHSIHIEQVFIEYLLCSKSWEYGNELDRHSLYTYGLCNPKG